VKKLQPDLTARNVLSRVIERIREVQDAVVVFDLDLTLFENAPRVIAIMREMARRHKRDMPWMAKRVAALAPEDMPFGHDLCLQLLGREVEPHIPKLRAELAGMFFTSNYLLHDVPYENAVEYVGACLMAGATIVYMTGRDRIGMYEGTVESLKEHDFPLGHPRVHLVMKPDQVTKDYVYKATLKDKIAEYGELVAFFDNEPANVNNFKEFYPDCISVLLDTKHSGSAPSVRDDVIKIKDYLSWKPKRASSSSRARGSAASRSTSPGTKAKTRRPAARAARSRAR
jgi:hypothetical protein